MFPKQLKRETLAEQIAAALIEFINAENLKPGDSLPATSVLVAQFGVSRPVIREALKTLEGREIIEIANGRKAIVKPISSRSLTSFFERALTQHKHSLIDLLEVRRGIEVESAYLAAQRRTEQHVSDMRAILTEMELHLHNPEPYTELDLRLHLLIALATHNDLMYHLVESIRGALRDAIMWGLRSRFSEEQLQHVQQLHVEIVQQIADKNPERAAAAMASHFDDAITAVFKAGIIEQSQAV